MEDLSPNEIDTVIYCLNKLDLFEKNKNPVDLIEFCVRVMTSKKCRIVSYINCYYKNAEIVEVDIDINYSNYDIFIKKYKRENDYDFMLKLGYQADYYFEIKSDLIFKTYNKMILCDQIAGTRYRRKDPIYLYWTIFGK